MWICGKIRAEVPAQFFPQVHINNNSDNRKFTIKFLEKLNLFFSIEIKKSVEICGICGGNPQKLIFSIEILLLLVKRASEEVQSVKPRTKNPE
ncbi:hypothetical protein EB354_14270 [Chryseobacterium balustinum]|nr:hypothetical protein EB354_14230 [Chryseobacterium balustinum]AZB30326.1 hypothetical protein EB354_14270 [Chryseobacterium balustinum]